MINIAICDDEPVDLNFISVKTSMFFKTNAVDVDIYLYSTGDALLKDSETVLFDILFLDIEMPGISGIEVANAIRSYNEYTKIIFITNKENLVFQSISYTPFRFIRKSYIREETEEMLISLLKKIKEENRCYNFITDEGTVNLKLIDIIYIEVFNHDITIHCKRGKVRSRGSLNKLEKEFRSQGFVRIHKSYLTNLKYIHAIGTKEIILDDKKTLPLSRYKINNVKLKFQLFSRSQR